MVYVNGDSYCVTSDGKKYSDFLGEKLQCSVVNNAIGGSSNARILRTSLRDLMVLKKKYANIVAVVSLSYIIRTEVWDPNIKNNRFINDGEFTSITPTHLKNWFFDLQNSVTSEYKDFSKQFLINYNVEAETIKLLQSIILFSTWCKYNNIKSIIFSGPLQEKVDFSSPFIQDFYQEFKQDNGIIDIFEFSFTQWCILKGFKPINANRTQHIHDKVYDVGHHGQAAHEAFANFLLEEHLNEI